MKRGFTLIELLIVVAIIGILAAIAVPNFMNAQMRARIARCYADIRSLYTAIESMRVDRGCLLVDFWDDDTLQGEERIKNKFYGVGGSYNSRGGTMGVLCPLTTPVPYMSSIPLDPFRHIDDFGYNDSRTGLISSDQTRPITYFYADEDPETPGKDFHPVNWGTMGISPLNEGEYVLLSYGPDQHRGGDVGFGFPYAMSNGLRSVGDVFLRSGGTTNENVQYINK